MATKIGLLILFVSIAIEVNAQRSKIKYGEVSVEELKMKVCDKDSTASAVVLFDYGELNLGDFKYYRHTKIKILKKEGYDYANTSLPIFGGEDISSLKAATYNLENGKIIATPLEQEGKFKEEFVEGIDIVKWAMPSVKEGSVIECKYEISRAGIRDWEFQRTIPTIHSEFKLQEGSGIRLQVFMQGYLSTQQVEDNHWLIKDAPAFDQEPFISSYQNYISRVNLEIASYDVNHYDPWNRSFSNFFIRFMTEWSDLSKQYNKEFFKNELVSEAGFLRSFTDELIRNCKHPDEKVRAIHSFVQSAMQWNERNTTLVRQRGLKKVFEEKTGTSGEINWIMLSMMRHAGLPADPVLISTRDNGFPRLEVPNKTKFNRVIVMTDYNGEKKMIDATDKSLAIDFLPETCLNGVGYWAKPVGFEWVELKNKNKIRSIYNIEAEVTTEGELRGKVRASKNGCAASDTRKKIKADQKKYFSELFKGVDFEVSQTKIENLDSPASPFTEAHHFILKDYAQTSNDAIYFKPIFITNLSENPFRLETRVYPVDFGYPYEIVFTGKFSIPDGYKAEELPKPKMIILPENAGKFVYNVSLQNETITVINQFVLSKPTFVQSEYPQLREFYNIIVAKQAEQIVLKKK
jgi:hypothetical protein